jgi:hypothetical protein
MCRILLQGRCSPNQDHPPACFRKAHGNGRSTRIRFFILGMSQLQAKQKTDARKALNQALTDGLQEPFATEAKRALAQLDRE